MTSEVSTMNTATNLANREYQGIGIPGLEHMPTSFIPVPRIKLVQSNTQDVLLADGQTEARKGTFYYENFQQTEDTLHIAILSAKPMTHTGPSLDDPTKEETKRSIGIIFYDFLLNKVFTMRFSPGSFQSWRKLVGAAVAAHEAGDMATFFSREVIVKTELIKDGSRSWYALVFNLGRVVSEEEMEMLTPLYEQFNSYFTQESDATKEEAA